MQVMVAKFAADGVNTDTELIQLNNMGLWQCFSLLHKRRRIMGGMCLKKGMDALVR